MILAPSLLSADLSRISDEVKAAEMLGLTWIHCDIMDGAFVPNLTFGPPTIKSLRPHTKSKLDAHLMVFHPEKRVPEFLAAGVDHITLHLESASQETLTDLLSFIRKSNKTAGISIRPGTPVSALAPFLDGVDLVLLMSVEPGFGGQKFMPESLNRALEIRSLIGNRNIQIQIDGGVSADNLRSIKDAGVDVAVVGNQFYGAIDRERALKNLLRSLDP